MRVDAMVMRDERVRIVCGTGEAGVRSEGEGVGPPYRLQSHVTFSTCGPAPAGGGH